MKHVYLLTLGLALLLGACQDSNDHNPDTTPISAQDDFISADHLAFIYDLNQRQNGLDVKAVTIPNPTGDKVWDLLIAFLSQCTIPPSLENIELIGINPIDDALHITFSTQSIAGDNWSDSLFFKALNMTLTRQLGNQKFEIRLNDKHILLSGTSNLNDHQS